jgi:hypothetical protein
VVLGTPVAPPVNGDVHTDISPENAVIQGHQRFASFLSQALCSPFFFSWSADLHTEMCSSNLFFCCVGDRVKVLIIWLKHLLQRLRQSVLL